MSQEDRPYADNQRSDEDFPQSTKRDPAARCLSAHHHSSVDDSEQLTNAGDAQRKPEKEYVPLKQTLQLYYATKNAPSPRGKNSEMIRRSMLSSGRKNRESRLLSSPSEFADQWQFDEFLPQNPRQMTAHTQMHSTQKAKLHATQNRAKTNISPHGCVPPKHVPASTRNKHLPLW